MLRISERRRGRQYQLGVQENRLLIELKINDAIKIAATAASLASVNRRSITDLESIEQIGDFFNYHPEKGWGYGRKVQCSRKNGFETWSIALPEWKEDSGEEVLRDMVHTTLSLDPIFAGLNLPLDHCAANVMQQLVEVQTSCVYLNNQVSFNLFVEFSQVATAKLDDFYPPDKRYVVAVVEEALAKMFPAWSDDLAESISFLTEGPKLILPGDVALTPVPSETPEHGCRLRLESGSVHGSLPAQLATLAGIAAMSSVLDDLVPPHC